MNGLLVILAFLGLFMLGFPVVLAIGLPCVVYLLANGLPLDLIAQRTLYAMDSFPLVAVPVFLFVGSVMNAAGISTEGQRPKLIDSYEKVVEPPKPAEVERIKASLGQQELPLG